MILKKFKNQIILTIFTLTLFITPTKIKADLPAIKGLYELLTPDVIGIGQALGEKWIENTYLYGSDKNSAKDVIQEFWYKPLNAVTHQIIENDVFNIKKSSPVLDLTAPTFGKLLGYIKKIKETKKINLSGKDKESIKQDKNNLIEAWLKDCEESIKTENNSKDKKDKIDAKEKEKLEINDKISKIQKNLKLIKASPQNKQTKIEIQNKEKEIRDYTKKLDNIDNTLKMLDYKNKLTTDINTIIKKIEKLITSEDFIPETTEAILWAFFESKFAKNNSQKEALKNTLACLKEFFGENNLSEPAKMYFNESIEFYQDNFYKKYEEEFKTITSTEDKINKIIKEYDKSTHSFIKEAKTKIVPPVVQFPSMEYKFESGQTPPFLICFEAAILDTINILLFNPKDKAYDLLVLPPESQKSDFFKTITDNVFKEENILIKPARLNSKAQNWIQNITNLSWLDYCKKEEINKGTENEKIVNYEVQTSIENFVKILNNFFNLGLEIEIDKARPEILKIKNFDKISKELEELNKTKTKEEIEPKKPEEQKLEKPKDPQKLIQEKAQNFLNKIFEYVSNKLSTNNIDNLDQKRSIKFTCELQDNKKQTFNESDNSIEISNSYGKINVNIEYENPQYKDFDVNFDLTIEDWHAWVDCIERKTINLDMLDRDFKDFLSKKICEEDNTKLFPIFILLADTKMQKKLDPKFINLFYYSLSLDSDTDKFKLITSTIEDEQIFKDHKTGKEQKLIEDSEVFSIISKMLDRMSDDPYFISEIFQSTINSKLDDNTKDIIIEKLAKASPAKILSKIATSEKDIYDKYKKFAKKILENNNIKLELSTVDSNGYTMLYTAQKRGYTELAKILLNHKDLKAFDKINYYINSDQDKNALEIINNPKNDISGPNKSVNPLYTAINKKNETILNNLEANTKINELIEQMLIDKTIIKSILAMEKLNKTINQVIEHIIKNNPQLLLTAIIEEPNNKKWIDEFIPKIFDNYKSIDNTIIKSILKLEKTDETINQVIEHIIKNRPKLLLTAIIEEPNNKEFIYTYIEKTIDKLDTIKLQILLESAIKQNKTSIKELIEKKLEQNASGYDKIFLLLKKINNLNESTIENEIIEIINTNDESLQNERNYFQLVAESVDKNYEKIALALLNNPNKPHFDPNSLHNGNIPLILAINNNNTIIIEKLLDLENINVNYFDFKTKNSPLHCAIINNNEYLIKLLLSKDKIDLNIKNRNNDTPLHLAIKNQLEKITQMLLDKKGDPNIINNDRETPLSIAIENNLENIINILLQYKDTNPNIKIKYNGITALDYAINYKKTKIAELLRAKGAKTSEELKI